MRYFLAICITVVLIVLFFFALFSVSEYGIVSLVIAGASGYGLYRIFKPMYELGKSGGKKNSREPRGDDPDSISGLFEMMLFNDLSCDADRDKWD